MILYSHPDCINNHRVRLVLCEKAVSSKVEIVNPEQSTDKAPLRQIKVIPHKDKSLWELCTKYNIGNSN